MSNPLQPHKLLPHKIRRDLRRPAQKRPPKKESHPHGCVRRALQAGHRYRRHLHRPDIDRCRQPGHPHPQGAEHARLPLARSRARHQRINDAHRLHTGGHWRLRSRHHHRTERAARVSRRQGRTDRQQGQPRHPRDRAPGQARHLQPARAGAAGPAATTPCDRGERTHRPQRSGNHAARCGRTGRIARRTKGPGHRQPGCVLPQLLCRTGARAASQGRDRKTFPRQTRIAVHRAVAGNPRIRTRHGRRAQRLRAAGAVKVCPRAAKRYRRHRHEHQALHHPVQRRRDVSLDCRGQTGAHAAVRPGLRRGRRRLYRPSGRRERGGDDRHRRHQRRRVAHSRWRTGALDRGLGRRLSGGDALCRRVRSRCRWRLHRLVRPDRPAQGRPEERRRHARPRRLRQRQH